MVVEDISTFTINAYIYQR